MSCIFVILDIFLAFCMLAITVSVEDVIYSDYEQTDVADWMNLPCYVNNHTNCKFTED